LLFAVGLLPTIRFRAASSFRQLSYRRAVPAKYGKEFCVIVSGVSRNAQSGDINKSGNCSWKTNQI
jgi:hypothetical protein